MKQSLLDILKEIAAETPEHIISVSDHLTSDSFNNYPEFLYKYRTCDKAYNFDMIEEEYLWADYPTKYDDPVDSAVRLRLKYELKDIECWWYSHMGEMIYYHIPPKGMKKQKHGQTLDKYKEAQKQYVDDNGRFNHKAALAAMRSEIGKLPPQKQRDIMKLFKDFESPDFEKKVDDEIHKLINSIVNSLREKTMLTCLTERKDNQNMWERYAGNYTGFVVEYARPDFVCLNEEQKDTIARMFKVSYCKRKPGVSLLPFIEYSFYKELYGKEIDVTDSIVKLYRQILYKRQEYSGEEEWRIIKKSADQKIPFTYVSGIYAGSKICDKDLEHLKKICKRKRITLYKLKFNLTTGEIEFDTVTEGKKQCVR